MSLAGAGDVLLEVSERLRGQSSLTALADECGRVLHEIGGYHFAAGLFSPTQPRDHRIIAVDYPTRWVDHYFANGYLEVDPTITTAASRSTPYEWRFDRPGAAKSDQLFRDVYDLGVRRGLTVPIHAPGGLSFVASFAGVNLEPDPRDRPMLSWLAAQFYEQYIDVITVGDRPIPVLSARERDCLTWVARGKSSWDIGQIIGISENTVNFHLKNTFAKLNVKGRTLGVVKAITLGLIEP